MEKDAETLKGSDYSDLLKKSIIIYMLVVK